MYATPSNSSLSSSIKRGLLSHRPFRSIRSASDRRARHENGHAEAESAPGSDRLRQQTFAGPSKLPDPEEDFVSISGRDTDDMGKSNKFDFSNRPNSSLKLGNSIASALTKEADKLITKARKQSTDSSTASEKDVPSCHIDLQAPKKSLGDEGLFALAGGLEAALRRGNDLASLALEDLNLSDNGITVAALSRLAPIIELARHDLKTLNLSSNKITVVTDEEAEQWEEFLRSFRDCLKLRRLDLSNNVGLGRRAIEVLARVHVHEPPITPNPPGGEASVLSLVSATSLGDHPDIQEADEGESLGGETMAKSLSDGTVLKRRCGLRSIPYITLTNTGMDDAAALWLSYVLEDHYYPNQLIDDLNGTHATTHIKAYQQGENTSGIDFDENQSTLSKEGLTLLQKTEMARRQILLDDQSTLADSLLLEDGAADGPGESTVQHRRASATSRFARSMPGDRRASIRSIHTIDGGEHEASELGSARRKIQRHIIEHHSPACTELWHAALILVAGSRLILFAAPSSRRYFTGEALFPAPTPTTPSYPSQPQAVTTPQPQFSPTPFSIDTAKANPTPTHKTSYAKTLRTTTIHPTNPGNNPGEPELALTDVTNTPTTPKLIFKPHRKGAFSEGTENLPAAAVTAKLHTLSVHHDNDDDEEQGSARFIAYQRLRTVRAARAAGVEGRAAWRDGTNPAHLPAGLVDRILGFVVGKREWELLGEEQRRAALKWGGRRETLKVAGEWRGRDMASRVWLLLDYIGCLAYRG
ncbi:hypothetical protein B0A50_00069 [Salinomyces thailandicus]|uniref:Leucine rich repeat protein n=1 Tax=Salinomyces thailandicus TaxID=706561 RepID=A0A4V5N649_9PEZI|nr:hypothetical protein B0A50_00069 [Salinomyces thailandica]